MNQILEVPYDTLVDAELICKMLSLYCFFLYYVIFGEANVYESVELYVIYTNMYVYIKYVEVSSCISRYRVWMFVFLI